MKCLLALVAITAAAFGQDTCSQFASCLETHRAKMATCLSSEIVSRRYQRMQRLCGQDLADARYLLIQASKDKLELESKRMELLSSCVNSPNYEQAISQDPRVFCASVYHEGRRLRKRRQSPQECRPRAIKESQRNCMQMARQCDKARTCHLCYEISSTHDQIKSDIYRILKQRAVNCPRENMPGATGRIALPGRDESMGFVMG